MDKSMILAIISILTIYILSLIGLVSVFRLKHRFLFSKITDLNNRIEDLQTRQLIDLRDEVRKHTRLFEMCNQEIDRPTTSLPHKFTSQSSEDILIYDFFKQYSSGFFVEAGAYDGVTFSNTFLLESLGWKGLLVEPHPKMADFCRRNRPNSTVVQSALGSDESEGHIVFYCADDPRGGAPLSFTVADSDHLDRCNKEGCDITPIKVPITTLNSILSPLTDKVDFLSLDAEGVEVDILKGFDLLKFQPELLLIEHQGDDRDVIVSEYLLYNGYIPFAKKGCNVFYTKESSINNAYAQISDNKRYG